MPVSPVSVTAHPASAAKVQKPVSDPKPASAPVSGTATSANRPAAAAAVVSVATAALQEATEPQSQTVTEAAHGDRAAQRILAKAQAAVAREGTAAAAKTVGARLDVKA